MAQNLSAGAQQEIAILTMARRKVDRIHGLTEQFAVAKPGAPQDQLGSMISRAALELGRALLAAGMGVIADQASQLGMLARRGGGPTIKLRGMRDFVAQLRPALDRAERAVLDRERAEHTQ
jgi:hypothetical protein